MQSGDSSIIELFDETGESLCSVVKRDGKVGEMSIVLLISWQAFGEAISIIVAINLLLKVGDVGLESLHLLSVDVVSNSDHGGKPIDDRPKLVSGWIGSGGEDVLYGGGG